MKITSTPIAGASVVELPSVTDERGAFTRWFCDQELESLLAGKKVVQANHSITQRPGTIRGMHYQAPPHAEIKLIRCIRGRVYDVVVDLRAGSATFLSWYGQELYEGDKKLIVVPEGCAHGFQVTDAGAELLYLHTAHYQPEHERGLRYNDPAIEIRWPRKAVDVSERDQTHPLVTDDFSGIVVT